MTTAPPVRERILASATRLFESTSIRAVSADRIVDDVGTTKVTFYRYFPTKDHLVVAYLDSHLLQLQDAVRQARTDGTDACGILLLMAEVNHSAACRPGFRGCIFNNAAAEYPMPDHPVRRAVGRYRTWLHDAVSGLLTDLGVDEPAAIAAQLITLRDGAMVAGSLDTPGTVADVLLPAGRTIIAAHRGGPLPA
ncbi:TetR/AcrR family transcriptional regulator [Arthrobacter echini]|uniref:TetR/AcrR family transcriptional regulator n=1 Tax=Arthrobacter echini TaxID=1529066 RepID=A0A5D0XVH9_9MICC|nr:TetR/AcrR family transcriptional regulator [Arthrobacter echini]TYD00237.1 TetR/AcrR family transcriptional regulator [Arthrobacter echini]